MRQFECYLCKGIFHTNKPSCLHYEKDEMDEEGEVSLCDNCTKFAQEKAIEKNLQNEVSRKFFRKCKK